MQIGHTYIVIKTPRCISFPSIGKWREIVLCIRFENWMFNFENKLPFYINFAFHLRNYM